MKTKSDLKQLVKFSLDFSLQASQCKLSLGYLQTRASPVWNTGHSSQEYLSWYFFLLILFFCKCFWMEILKTKSVLVLSFIEVSVLSEHFYLFRKLWCSCIRYHSGGIFSFLFFFFFNFLEDATYIPDCCVIFMVRTKLPFTVHCYRQLIVTRPEMKDQVDLKAKWVPVIEKLFHVMSDLPSCTLLMQMDEALWLLADLYSSFHWTEHEMKTLLPQCTKDTHLSVFV